MLSQSSDTSSLSSEEERELVSSVVVAAALVQPYQNEPIRKGSPPPHSAQQQERLLRVGSTNWRYRYTAYRNIIAWAWGKLGKGTRRPLPSCVISKIRQSFPDPEGKYVGYQDVDVDV